MSTLIQYCRICRNSDLISVFDLGTQALGSRFPAADESDPIEVPLVLVKCNNGCGLLQLNRNTDAGELYLQHYGYRSGLNNTMIQHLTNLVHEIQEKVWILPNDIVLDIGSNDCTLLKAYELGSKLRRVGIDPTGTQFKQYYPEDVCLLPTFFNQEVFSNKFGEDKAKVVTTISMFYDLPDPLAFAQDIKNILAKDGIWVTEQSYCITMLENNSFDTICHEHLEYYTLKQILYIADKVGLKVIDVSLNDCNGGSFRCTLTHADNDVEISDVVQQLQYKENALDSMQTLQDFIDRCEDIKTRVMNFLTQEKSSGKTIYLLGASTKGNTLLQYYGLDNTIITAAGERNPEKYGRRTPKTNIPIISEIEMREAKPDYLLVLPWHFKKELLERERQYLENGGAIIFPMPVVEIYTHDSVRSL